MDEKSRIEHALVTLEMLRHAITVDDRADLDGEDHFLRALEAIESASDVYFCRDGKASAKSARRVQRAIGTLDSIRRLYFEHPNEAHAKQEERARSIASHMVTNEDGNATSENPRRDLSDGIPIERWTRAILAWRGAVAPPKRKGRRKKDAPPEYRWWEVIHEFLTGSTAADDARVMFDGWLKRDRERRVRNRP